MTTDIVASTEIVWALGDEAWLSVIGEHDALVESRIHRFGGVVFKHTGDGLRSWFLSATAAVLAAQSVLDEFASRRFHDGRVGMQLRAGISIGTPLGRDGDLFGLTVIEAGRLCDAAPNGGGLASAAVAAAADLPLAPHGPLSLKGFGDPVETFRIEPRRPSTTLDGCVGGAILPGRDAESQRKSDRNS